MSNSSGQSPSSTATSTTPVTTSTTGTSQPGTTVTTVTTVTATSSVSTTTTPIVSTTAKGSLVLTAQTNATLGTYLVGSNGMTVYTSANDTAGVSNCTGECAAEWPPYTVDPTIVSFAAGTGVRGAISVITRADGTRQITYNNMPLYFYVGDTKSGDTNGQNVSGFTIVRE